MSKPTLESTTVPTPFGPFSAIWTADNTVIRAAGFGSAEEVALLLPGNSRKLATHRVTGATAVSEAVDATLEGDSAAFRQLRVEQPGKPFFQSCWMVLRGTDIGQRLAYADVAQQAGKHTARRAVRRCCGLNRIGWIVPGHRAVSTTGRLVRTPMGSKTVRDLLSWEATVGPDLT